jgi:tRNA(Glu) U13 pseudouridine synthase TruD
LADAKDFEAGSLEDDDLNSGMKKTVFEFMLGKGCYATEFIKQLFC